MILNMIAHFATSYCVKFVAFRTDFDNNVLSIGLTDLNVCKRHYRFEDSPPLTKRGSWGGKKIQDLPIFTAWGSPVQNSRASGRQLRKNSTLPTVFSTP